ncbi:hypothetical protein BaRGS_00035004, partial [Batillaria attramentaria]
KPSGEVTEQISTAPKLSNNTTDKEKGDNNVNMIAIVIPVVLMLVLICAALIEHGKNQNNDHGESNPLVSVTPSHVVSTAATGNR